MTGADHNSTVNPEAPCDCGAALVGAEQDEPARIPEGPLSDRRGLHAGSRARGRSRCGARTLSRTKRGAVLRGSRTFPRRRARPRLVEEPSAAVSGTIFAIGARWSRMTISSPLRTRARCVARLVLRSAMLTARLRIPAGCHAAPRRTTPRSIHRVPGRALGRRSPGCTTPMRGRRERLRRRRRRGAPALEGDGQIVGQGVLVPRGGEAVATGHPRQIQAPKRKGLSPRSQ